MTDGERRRFRPFPSVGLEFGRDGVTTAVSERIAAGAGDGAAGATVTAGVGELERILEAAALRHADLSREIAQSERVLADLRRRLWLYQLLVARLIMSARIPRLIEQGRATIDDLARERSEREAGKVEVRFATDTATAAAYAALTRAFEGLAQCERIWDVSAASPDSETSRPPVAFSAGVSDIVACPEEVLVAPRGRGGSLQFLPGFVLLRGPSDAIVLEHGDVELLLTPVRFLVESDAVPGDAKVVGQALPPESDDQNDREEKEPLPVVEYGRVTVQASHPALDQQPGEPPAYVFSSFAKARVFVEAYRDYKQTLAAIVAPEPSPAAAVEPPRVAGPPEPPLDIRPRGRLWLDAAAIVLLVFLLGLPFVLFWPAPPAPPAPLARPIAAVQLVGAKPKDGVHSPARPTPRPRRGRPGETRQEFVKLCGPVRQPSGVLKLVPCADTAATAATRP